MHVSMRATTAMRSPYTTEMDELKHCDNVYVFRNGRVVAELSRGELTEEKVLQSSFEQEEAA